MLVRIVKMSFDEMHIEEFLRNFHSQKESIRHFKGCQFLELYRDKHNPSIFFTYSHWETEEALELYRDSNLFTEVWSKTKPLFNQKPKAWSVDKLATLG